MIKITKKTKKTKKKKIIVENTTNKNDESSQKCDYEEYKYRNDFYEQGFTIAPAVSLFAGICIGVGLASHSLITQWR